MLPARPVDLAAGAAEHRVVDRDPQGGARRQEQQDRQRRDGQAQVVGVPAGPGEEAVRPVVRPRPGQARAQQHPGHRPAAGLPGQPRDQAAERSEPRRGEARPQRGQDLQQRTG